jgi:hypothetical protein
MDPLNLETIKATIDEVNSTTIPLLEAAIGRQLAQANKDAAEIVDRAVGEISNIINGALQGVQAITAKAMIDLNAIVDRLNGASFSLGPSKGVQS